MLPLIQDGVLDCSVPLSAAGKADLPVLPHEDVSEDTSAANDVHHNNAPIPPPTNAEPARINV